VSLASAEIAQQPDVVARLLDRERIAIDALAAELRRRAPRYAVLAARGTSDNAARYAQHVLGRILRLPVVLATPSLHTLYDAPPRYADAVVIGISQSGASPDIVSVVAEGTNQGALTAAITNAPSSPLAGAAQHVIDLGAGEERSVAATKTYTSSVLAVALLAVALGDPGDEAEYVAELRRTPDAVAAAISGTVGLEQAAAVLAAPLRGVVVGRGLNLGTAYEAALKLTELTGSLMAPYSPADLLHGPVAALGPDVPVLAVAPDEPASEGVLELAREAARRGSPVLVLGPQGVGDPLVLPSAADTAPWLTPLTAVVPAQLLAQLVAESRGVDVDRPGGLAKVTRTT
jgi:glutamine---fructose-6-phosphate transaminase (isomerizing)